MTAPLQRVSLSEQAAGGLLLLAALLFVIAGAVSLYLTPSPVMLTAGHLIAVVGGWAVAWGASVKLLGGRLGDFDRVLLAIVALLTGWGLILQARLAPALLIKQVLWLLGGCGLMCGIAVTPSIARMLRRYRYTLLTAGILLLGATLVFGVNPSGYGQELWLGAFGIYLQPSEPLKLLLVIYLAAYLSERREIPKDRTGQRSMWSVVLGPMAVMVGGALLLLGWQQDLGAALLFYLIFMLMIYLAWGNGWYVVLSLIGFLPIGLAGYLLSPRVALRVSIWLDPWAPEQADRAYQILQSLFAFGAGGLFGRGLGQGRPGLIPAVHTDFVYAALVEEFGLIGGLACLLLLALFILRAVRLAQRSESGFEALLAAGIAAWVGIQTWVITGGNAKLIPLTGVTLPFLSYGGSSLVTLLAATGLLLNLSAPHPLTLNLSLVPDAAKSLRTTSARLGQGLQLLLASVAVISGNWAVARAETLQTYPTNLRYVLSEARLRRGRILDRNQIPLADIAIDAEGFVTRTYPQPEAAPIVGYATFAYGAAGIEAACDTRLRGELYPSVADEVRRELLHLDPVGRDVRLTIDARLQARAQQLIAPYVGAAVLLDAHSGEILALASSPTYDSATVATQWAALREQSDSPFLNRATFGLAQPGTTLQPLILSAALQANPTLTPAEPVAMPIPFDGMHVFCRRPVGQVEESTSWRYVLGAACPYPFVAAALQVGPQALREHLTQLGLLDAPALVLPTVAVDLGDSPLQITDDALGQGELLVTPLQMARAIAVVGNDGVRPNLRLLVTPLDGCERREFRAEERVLSAEVAEAVRHALPEYYGRVGHLGTSFAGPLREQAWFTGLNSATLPRYAVAVFLDQPEYPYTAVEIGAELLQLVLDLQAAPVSGDSTGTNVP